MKFPGVFFLWYSKLSVVVSPLQKRSRHPYSVGFTGLFVLQFYGLSWNRKELFPNSLMLIRITFWETRQEYRNILQICIRTEFPLQHIVAVHTQEVAASTPYVFVNEHKEKEQP